MPEIQKHTGGRWGSVWRAPLGLLVFLMTLWGTCLAGVEATPEELAPFSVRAHWLVDDLDGYAGMGQILDGAWLRETGADTVADILRTRAGVFFRSFSGNGAAAEPDLRGFGENSGLRTLVLVDGQPLNRPDMGAASWLEIPVGQVERIEVLRGAQTARYGDRAVGGVINITTRLGEGAGKGHWDVSVQGGADSTRRGRVSWAGARGPVTTAWSFEDQSTAGYRENSGYDARASRLNLGGGLGGRGMWRAGLSWTDEAMAFPGPLTEGRYLENPRQSIYSQFGVGDQYGSETRTIGINGALQQELGETGRWRGTMRGGLSRRDISWDMGAGSHADNALLRAEIRPGLTWRPGGAVDALVLGVDVLDDRLELDFFRTRDRREATGLAELNRQALSVYLTGEGRLDRRWSWELAVRGERVSTEGESARLDPGQGLGDLLFAESQARSGTSFDSALLWQWTRSGRAWLRVNRLFRFPITDEIAAYQGFPLAEAFNRELDPERGHQVEIGVSYDPGPVSLRVNSFALWMDGEIAFDNVARLNTNLSATRRLGIEVSVAREGETWGIQGLVTVIDARFREGPYASSRVPLVPGVQANLVLRWSPVAALELVAEGLAATDAVEGNDFFDERPRLPGWVVMNVMGRWRWNSHWSLTARLNNLFDTRYATLKYNGLWYPAAGFQFRAGVRAEF